MIEHKIYMFHIVICTWQFYFISEKSLAPCFVVHFSVVYKKMVTKFNNRHFNNNAIIYVISQYADEKLAVVCCMLCQKQVLKAGRITKSHR